MQVTERTLGSLGMSWGDLLQTFGHIGGTGKRPDELRWMRPAPPPASEPRPAPLTPSRRCATCGAVYEKGQKYTARRWAKSRCCSRACEDDRRREIAARAADRKPCQQCGIEMIRACTQADWARKRFCSPACRVEARRSAACSVCGKPTRARGLCSTHYMRLKRGGLKRRRKDSPP